MKFCFNIEKKYVMFLSVLIVFAGIGFVVAEVPAIWSDSVHDVWHSAEDIKVTIGSVDMSLQEAIDNELLGSGVTPPEIPTDIPSSNPVLVNFRVSEGSEKNYISQCPLTNFAGNLLAIDQGGRHMQYEHPSSEPQIDASSLASGDIYEFSCSYGQETNTQVKRFVLDDTYKLIARGTENHVVSYPSFWQFWAQETYAGTDTFGFYVALGSDGKLNFRVKLIESCSEANLECDTYCASTGGEIVDNYYCEGSLGYGYNWEQRGCGGDECEVSEDCPVYQTSDQTRTAVYAWKGMSCKIRDSGLNTPAA